MSVKLHRFAPFRSSRRGWLIEDIPLVILPEVDPRAKERWRISSFWLTPPSIHKWSETERLRDEEYRTVRDAVRTLQAVWQAGSPPYNPPAAARRKADGWRSGCGHWRLHRSDVTGLWHPQPATDQAGKLTVEQDRDTADGLGWNGHGSLYSANLLAWTISRNIDDELPSR